MVKESVNAGATQRTPIQVTKPYLPDRAKLDRYINQIYERTWLTNNGPLVQQLTTRLSAYLGVENLLLVSNGTLALQVAYRALGLRGEAITTPFSFAATASSLAWEGIRPVFSDIDPDTLCLDPRHIENAITRTTSAIVPTHVFGNACDVTAIEAIAGRNGLQTVYDGAHAFAVDYDGASVLRHGDAATLSFHATKLFHTIEGGAIVFRDPAAYERARSLINFGIDGPDRISALGINAKMNEFQAAMGLCVLDEIDTILENRRAIWGLYQEGLQDVVTLPALNRLATPNYGYFPVLLQSEEAVLDAVAALVARGIHPRRYFYPSLDTVAYLQPQRAQSVSRDVAGRVLCLPIYPGLAPEAVATVIDTLRAAVAATPLFQARAA